MGGTGGPRCIPVESENIKSFGGKHPLPPIAFLIYILYLNSPLLATFYTLSFLDYIPLTASTCLNLHDIQYICMYVYNIICNTDVHVCM